MPMSRNFRDRIEPVLERVADHYGTPFHLYDETGIRDTCHSLKHSFAGIPDFKEFFAVKALPNPAIMKIIRDEGFGFDCSSIPELVLARGVGAPPLDIMFTSNNTSLEEFHAAAASGGCILNLDDISLIPKLPLPPNLICFRYNPGDRRSGNSIIGNPVEAKFGVPHEQLLNAYRAAVAIGVRYFGIHTMLVSNERDYHYMVETVSMLLKLVEWLSDELSIKFEFINMGGGLGIPYHPNDTALNLSDMAWAIQNQFEDYKSRNGYIPSLHMESGRYVTGPHGILVTRVINLKNSYRHYVGVDASMSALMRPGMYGAFHHIDILGKQHSNSEHIVDVVGSLCENNDKFAVERALPAVEIGDLLILHDTGAHGHSMGFNYNGRLRPKELLLRADGSIELIRREETLDDYFASLTFKPDQFMPLIENTRE